MVVDEEVQQAEICEIMTQMEEADRLEMVKQPNLQIIENLAF